MAHAESVDWRSHARYKLDHPAHVVIGRARILTHLIDASDGGLRLRMRSCLKSGELYLLEVSVADKVHQFFVIPRWDRYDDGQFLVGAELGDEDDTARWRACREEILAAHAGGPPEKRRTRRVNQSRPILYLDRERWVKGTLKNVSETADGALVVVAAAFPPAPWVRFRVKVGATDTSMRARTVWVRFQEGLYHLGIKCIEPEATIPV